MKFPIDKTKICGDLVVQTAAVGAVPYRIFNFLNIP